MIEWTRVRMHVIVHLVGNFDRIPLMFIDWIPIVTQGVYVLIVSFSFKYVLKSFPKNFNWFELFGEVVYEFRGSYK